MPNLIARLTLGLALTSCLAGFVLPLRAQVTVAAAADLGPALSEISKSYQQKSGNQVKVSLGSSGNLTQQIKNGAPFDLFLSADVEYPKQLVDGGFAVRDSLYSYAVGKLVLWVPVDSRLEVLRDGMRVLLDPSVQKIAIANPVHAPYGRAAAAALRHYGLYSQVEGKLVLGENVAQAAQFVESGNAQVGLIAYSHAMAPGMKDKGRYWEVPGDAYPELDQAAVIISHSQHKKEASAFLEYLKTADARAVLRRYGFSVPGDNR